MVGRSVTPLMLRMIDALDATVSLDLPYLTDERTKRITDLLSDDEYRDFQAELGRIRKPAT